MREHFQKSLLQPKWQRARSERQNDKLEALAQEFFCDDPGVFMSYWYGSLYVVVEDWRDLSLHDSVIDALISDPKIELLKRYRNGAFHFQKHYFDQRFQRFVEETDSATWVRKLNSEFGRYFLAVLGTT